MAKQLTIADIAKLSGVSAGTVDRILHNRGKVAPATRAAVEKVLQESGYRFNIHTSAVALKKGYRITVTMPSSVDGEYWNQMLNGIGHALDEFSDIKLECGFCFYNPFDMYSCRTVFESIPAQEPDAVLIGPIFPDETMKLCNSLKNRNIPYVFVDEDIPGSSPVASYSTDQTACGRLMGKLLHLTSTPPIPKTEY